MQRLLKHFMIALCFVITALAGCSSDYAVVPTEPYINLTARYHSTEQIGELGVLTLEIRALENKPWYKAWLAGAAEESGLSESIGTIGDGHLILNFDRGLDSDFYFEGDVEGDGGAGTVITGYFIFPDHSEPLAVVFEFVEPLPPLPPADD